MRARCPKCNSVDVSSRNNAFARVCRHCNYLFDMRDTNPKPVIPAQAMREFVVFNHQGKANRLIEALQVAGYTVSPSMTNYRGVRFALTDYAAWGRASQLRRIQRQGVHAFFVYPHSARPNLITDVEPEWDGISAQFVTAPGHVEILQSYGYPKPLHVVGWILCKQREFKPRAQARNVLFAPIHPRCDEVDKMVNRKAFMILSGLAKRDAIRLTVRYIINLEGSGLERVTHPNISYVEGKMNNSYDQIDNADVVVGHNTLAYISVARGVPTVMMADRDIPEHWLKHPTIFARTWKKYADKMAYPLDILRTSNPLKLLERAVKSDYGIQTWRKRMIGKPFDAKLFVKTLEGYL